MKKLIILLVLLSFFSCDITKRAVKGKNDINQTETVETKTVRSGDTLRISIPKVTYKDTTIVKTNYVNRTEARITYDNKGNAEIECISAEIQEFRKEMRTLVDKSKAKESEKEENFDASAILYFMIGLAVIVCGAMFVFMWQLSKQTKAK
jgi:hypothetical protein